MGRAVIKIKGSAMKVKKLVLFVILVLPLFLGAKETKVFLLSGGEDQIRGQVENTLTDILNCVNRYYDSQLPLNNLREAFTESAFQDLTDLVKQTKFYATQKEYRTYLLVTSDGYFEVRNIKVRVFLGGTEGIPFQNLVFVIDKKGIIINVHFALEDHQYQEIIAQGKKLEDLSYREKILHFIELYRTAYNKKDYDFIENTLSDDALIIVGRVVETKKQKHDYLEKSYLSSEKIEFIKLSKNEYLQRLEKVFKNNDFVRVEFDQINIQRHPQFEKIYGVQLKQKWKSSFYSDEGYLFLLVDFIEENPLIHVRAWQPDRFTDGSTINIYDFEIIE